MTRPAIDITSVRDFRVTGGEVIAEMDTFTG